SSGVIWSFILNGTIALVGIIRAKYLAITFGAAAVGLLSQVFQLQLISLSIGSLALVNGIVAGLSKSETEEEKSKILSTAFWLQLTCSVVLSAVVIILAKPFSIFAFGSDEYSHLVIITMIGVPFVVLANHQLQAVFFANNGFDWLNKVMIVVNITNLLLFFILVEIWSVDGAVSTVTTLAIIQFVFFLFAVRRYRSFKNIFGWLWDKKTAFYLITFATTSLSTYLLIYGGNFLIRRKVIHELGLEENGILQVPISLSMYYVPLISWVLWGKVYPVLVKEQLTAADNFKSILNRSLWAFVLMATIIILFKKYIVLILLSNDFLPALPLISNYLLGDLFFIICTIYGAYLMALHRLKAYLIGHVIFISIYLIGVYYFLPSYGLLAVPYSFIAAGVTTFLFLMIYMAKNLRQLVSIRVFSTITSAILIIFTLGYWFN
ncbi:MAG: hypothetical protein KDD40_07310, partial [Bdellovibrionales bacterium]|nr:hypothetical protein [Bdellovibrionales bacterium]